MPTTGWTVGPVYDGGPVTARRTASITGANQEISIDSEGEIAIETEVGYSGYHGCDHSVAVYVPVDTMLEFLRAHGYTVIKNDP